MHIEKLEAVAKRSAANLKTLVSEMSDEINEAIIAATEQAEIDGKEGVTVTLSHTIKLDIGKDKQEDTLAVSVRHKATLEGYMPDPSQPELSLIEEEAESEA